MSQAISNSDSRYFMDTENQYFFHFMKRDFEHRVNAFCDELRMYNITGAKPSMVTMDYLKPLKRIMLSITPPYTVILEHYYVDKSFRDSYYRYFSSSHFNTDRSSRRLSFFRGLISEEELFDFNIPCVSIQKVQEGFYKNKKKLIYYGSIVLNPVMTGAIGRTILDPRCLNLQRTEESPTYMRLSNFKTHLYGRTLKVNAFPYRMQDGETITCSEVTFLNLLDYYSNHYPDYRSALPGEVLDEEQRHSEQRVLPSKGMDYATMSKLMSNFGFFPRLYDISSLEAPYVGSRVTEEIILKRWMYYYIESGIPVAVELGSSKSNEAGHSVVCIGHGAVDKQKIREAYILGHQSGENRIYLNSADFHDTYVVIDDNKPVYNIRHYEKLSLYDGYKVKALAVPLNRRMYLDAPDAESTVLTILDDEKLGLDKWIKKDYLKKDEAVVMRFFLASSHSLKSYRVRTLPNDDLKAFYAYIPMPRFVWVCELYKVKEYLNHKGTTTDSLKAFGEIILDTTYVPTEEYSPKSLILVHYIGCVAALYPEDIQMGFDKRLLIDNDEPFPGFGNNLAKII